VLRDFAGSLGANAAGAPGVRPALVRRGRRSGRGRVMGLTRRLLSIGARLRFDKTLLSLS